MLNVVKPIFRVYFIVLIIGILKKKNSKIEFCPDQCWLNKVASISDSDPHKTSDSKPIEISWLLTGFVVCKIGNHLSVWMVLWIFIKLKYIHVSVVYC